LRDRSDNFVIGRMLGLEAVGIYSVGAEIAALPTTELVSPLGRACFSTFAAARNSGTAMGETYLRLMGLAALLGVPAGLGLSLLADPIVRLAFGDRWLGAIGLIQLLGVTATATIFGMLSVALLNAHAVLKPQFRVQVVATVLRVAAMIALVPWFGLLGAAVGMSLSLAVENLCYTAMALGRLGLRFADLLRHVWRSVLASLAMAAALAAMGLGWTDTPEGSWSQSLVLGVPAGVVVYAVVVLGLWRLAGCPAGAEQDGLSAVRAAILPRLRGLRR
jgi:O-antigen/teichoic acid export membrane protein